MGRRKGVSGGLPSSRRGVKMSDVSVLRTSLAVGAGESTCQLLLVNSEPLRNESVLPPAMDKLLRRTWTLIMGALVVSWSKSKFFPPLFHPVQLSRVSPAVLLFWSKPFDLFPNETQFR